MYNLKRERMIKKYGSIVGKEKMLFHGTSFQNLEKINADGLNRIYAGTHGKIGGSSLRIPSTFMKHLYLCCNVLYQTTDNQTNRLKTQAEALMSDIRGTVYFKTV